MNGYREVVGMLLQFCAERGIDTNTDELHAWVTHYFEVRFVVDHQAAQDRRNRAFRERAREALHAAGQKCLDRTCPICADRDPEQLN